MSEAFDKLKSDIMSTGILGTQQATGFYECYCPVCGDTRRKTAGFKLENDSVGLHCFRASCDASVVYKDGEPMSRKFRELMERIGVTVPLEIRKIRSNFQNQLKELEESDLYKRNSYKEMQVPDGWISWEEDPSIFGAWEEFMDMRCCSMHDCFYITTGRSKGLIAQACRFYDKLIGFQVINPFGDVKYFNVTDNENMLYVNGGKIRQKTLVVEGVLDAKCFPNTVATLSGSITPEKAFHLRGRDVILLPDRSGNKFIDAAKEYGWKIALPDWGEKDLNEAVQRYGRIEAANMIVDSTFGPDEYHKARLKYKIWVER